jgi:hypothetical protein
LTAVRFSSAGAGAGMLTAIYDPSHSHSSSSKIQPLSDFHLFKNETMLLSTYLGKPISLFLRALGPSSLKPTEIATASPGYDEVALFFCASTPYPFHHV